MKHLKKGQQIKDYTLDSFLGEGATAVVWSARNVDGKIFALKIFAPKTNLDQFSKLLIKEEFDKSKNLNHPAIIKSYDHFEFEDSPVLVMDKAGASLWSVLIKRLNERKINKIKDRENIYSEKEFAYILKDIGGALDHLHQKRMVHHDVKLANILEAPIDNDAHYSLSDFGITKQIRETILRQTQSKESSSLSLAYAAPERLNGTDHENIQSDIFSLGASLYELTNGLKIPPGEILNNNGKLESIKGRYSNRLKKIILSCLDRDPNKRPTSKQIVQITSDYLNQGYWSNIETEVIDPKEKEPSDIRTTQLQQASNIPYANSANAPDLPIEHQPNLVTSDSNPITAKLKKKRKFWYWAIPLLLLIGGGFYSYTNQFFGWFDKEFNYDMVLEFHGNCACAEKNGARGIINKDGNAVTPLDYQFCFFDKNENKFKLTKKGKNEFYNCQ